MSNWTLQCPSCRRDSQIETGIFRCLNSRPGRAYCGAYCRQSPGFRRDSIILGGRIQADFRCGAAFLVRAGLLGHDRYRLVLEAGEDHLRQLERPGF